GVVGAMAAPEALLVRLGEVQYGERLAQAPRRVPALRLRVETAKELVALDAVRIAAEDLRLRFDGLVEVLRDVRGVELREDVAALFVVRVERLRGLVRVDGHLGLVQELLIELAELVEDLRERGAVLRFLRLIELELEVLLGAVVIALLAGELE